MLKRAGQHEPYESRGSRPDLLGPDGETSLRLPGEREARAGGMLAGGETKRKGVAMEVTVVRAQRTKWQCLAVGVRRNCSPLRPGSDAMGAYTLVGVRPPHGTCTNARRLHAHSCNQSEAVASDASKEGK